MKIKGLVAGLGLALLLAGCAQGQGPGTKQTVGGLGGAALGGLFGAQFGSGTGKLAATAAGVLAGALVGSEIGRYMDDADQDYAYGATTQAQSVPVGQTISWNNPNSGNYGTVTPVRDGTSTSGAYCREFQQTVTVGGRYEEAYGVACRQPDGSWRVVQ
jgi:surface antigen